MSTLTHLIRRHFQSVLEHPTVVIQHAGRGNKTISDRIARAPLDEKPVLKMMSSGKALSNTRVRILDEKKNELPDRVIVVEVNTKDAAERQRIANALRVHITKIRGLHCATPTSLAQNGS